MLGKLLNCLADQTQADLNIENKVLTSGLKNVDQSVLRRVKLIGKHGQYLVIAGKSLFYYPTTLTPVL